MYIKHIRLFLMRLKVWHGCCGDYGCYGDLGTAQGWQVTPWIKTQGAFGQPALYAFLIHSGREIRENTIYLVKFEGSIFAISQETRYRN